MNNNNFKKGFALIEILIAITILSISLLGIISSVSAGILAISGNKNMTKAILIAGNMMNEFEENKMKGPDVVDKDIEEYKGFTYSRETKRFEHELFGPLDAQRVVITVKWQERGLDKNYMLSYIYSNR